MPISGLSTKDTRRVSGFTLVELLITISVIAILGAIGIRVYGVSLKNASDQQRLKDLNSVKQALELYRYDARAYPETINFSCSSNVSFGYGERSYLAVLPKDPNCGDGRGYVYRSTNCTGESCSGYVLCAKKVGTRSYTLPSLCSTTSCGTVGNCDMGVEPS